MTPLRQHMIAALQLSGNGERTQESSVREVRLRAQCYRKAPDCMTAQELQRSFLHRKNIDGLAPASMRICSSGIRFFSQHVLQRDWHTLSLMRAHTTHHLPAVLSVEEVRRLLAAAPLYTPKSPSPRSLAWASGSMKPSPSRSLTSTASASRSMSIAGRAPRTGTSPCLPRRWRCSAPPGKPTGTPRGSFLLPGGINTTVPRQLLP